MNKKFRFTVWQFFLMLNLFINKISNVYLNNFMKDSTLYCKIQLFVERLFKE